MNLGSTREEELFADALARPLDERAAFLDGACRGDTDLRAKLEALLAAHESSDSLLGAPVAPRELPVEEKPGDMIGPPAVGSATAGRYKLLQKIGEGGCGVVWMAEQEEPVRRRVALKVIKLGMDTKSVVARFEAERQALAMMDHPNIAKVYDAGATETGRPYFVMELIRGIPITKYCDENHLTPAARLELFVKVCQAIQHAHQKGVIHRDIKPSNILVTVNDGQPTPKVIDFGIAKATQGKLTDATVFTAFEQFIGTPVYMSPEQAEMSSLDIDTRSDIYSLGVLLYELLAGRPPFDPKKFAQAGVDEIRKQIREVDPARPSARLRTLTEEEQTTIARLRSTAPAELSVVLRGDLDWIIMRCLEKDRTRRYETANGVAMDIQRYLRHEPVTARPPSSLYLAQKLVRRHRLGFAAAAIVLGVIVAGALATAAQATRALRAERQQFEMQEAARQAQVRAAEAGRLAEEQKRRHEKQEWVRQHVLPEIRRLLQAENRTAALTEATMAEKHLAGDPELIELWGRIAVSASIESTPSGADIYVKSYATPAAEWRHLGRTPIAAVRVPREISRWRVRKEGMVEIEEAAQPTPRMSFALDAVGSIPPGMVRIPASKAVLLVPESSAAGAEGGGETREVSLESYFIDRFEVTNRQFKAFVDQGGYATPKWWRHPFVREGRRLEWDEAMALFRDTTGRPAPASWSNGTYPSGEDDHPVTGVSWFEAAAYAEFAGKRLPSLYHWELAATGPREAIVQQSNFNARGLAPAGSFPGITKRGLHDMAGNVKEWCWNEAEGGWRYILGGSWREPVYMFVDRDARSPFDRSTDFGFRCMKLAAGTPAATGFDDPIRRTMSRFQGEQPVGDDIFNAYRGLFAYHKTPLEARSEALEDGHPGWRRERVSFAAAYGNERVPAYLFLPRNAVPPFQTVVYFPGTNAFALRNQLTGVNLWRSLIEGGRAFVLPVYQGMYERGTEGRERYIDNKNVYPDLVVQWSKDLGRTIDYLETRGDIRATQIAFLGYSLGGAMGAILPALEPRLKANILVSGGVRDFAVPPQVDQVNFAPRVKIPTLMLNGRYDFVFTEPSQRQLFRLLGASPENKRHVIFETGHIVGPGDFLPHVLDWLDRHLGPAR